MNSATTLTRKVNDILTSYVTVHDAIFGFSLRKVLPLPWLFLAIRYCNHETALSELTARLGSLEPQISAVKGGASGAEDRFVLALSEYATTLQDTINKLQNICHHLCRKSKGARDYSKQRYDADVKAYDEAVHRYTQLGKELNALYAETRGAT